MAMPSVQSTATNTAISTTTQLENGLGIIWHDGFKSFFHHIWLRDCCYCDHCGDSYSSKRYIVPSDIPLDNKPGAVNIDENGNLYLMVAWRSSLDLRRGMAEGELL